MSFLTVILTIMFVFDLLMDIIILCKPVQISCHKNYLKFKFISILAHL